MSELANIPGLYGKIPVLGDFVTRRLTTSFVDAWDRWLQSALSASREQLGSNWLEIYLTSPIWHFYLSPGICGPTSWTGILMPSVDKVGRYFPLTLAVPTDPSRSPSDLFIDTASWFDRMEALALSALEDNINLSDFDRRLQAQPLPEPPAHKLTAGSRLNFTNKDGFFTFNMSMNESGKIAEAFAQLGIQLLSEMHPTYSLWSTTGSGSMKSCLRVYESLPPSDAFSELLIGQEDSAVNERETETTVLPDDNAPPVKIILEPADEEVVERQIPQNDPAAAWQDDLDIDDQVSCQREISVSPNVGFIENQRIQWQSFAATNVGKHRKINEDAYLESPEIGLWAVADGMGGHSAGDVASKTVIEALATLVATGNLESYTACATECLRTVNDDLLSMADKLGDGRIIGTTIVVMLAVGTRCAAIWAGDSRLYQYRDGSLTQLTSDHSLATELSQQGVITADEPQAEKMENIVTRALGAESDPSLDVVTFDAQIGDRYLLCSDGLIKEVHNQEIADILNQGVCKTCTNQLIELALERDARDNVTVIVANASQPESSEGPWQD